MNFTTQRRRVRKREIEIIDIDANKNNCKSATKIGTFSSQSFRDPSCVNIITDF